MSQSRASLTESPHTCPDRNDNDCGQSAPLCAVAVAIGPSWDAHGGVRRGAAFRSNPYEVESENMSHLSHFLFTDDAVRLLRDYVSFMSYLAASVCLGCRLTLDMVLTCPLKKAHAASLQRILKSHLFSKLELFS